MIALACGLRVRGHHVEFVAPANFVAWIRGHGFACESDGVDVEAMLRSAAVDLQSARQQMRYLRAELAPRLFDTAPRAGRDADMIVGSGMQIAAPSIADLRGVPYVGVGFCPCVVPSSDAPPPMIRTQTLPRWMNRVLWRCAGPLADRMLRGPINDGRRRIGLAPVRRPLTSLLENVLVAADRELAPPGAGTRPTVVQTDAWILDSAAAL